MNSKKCKQLRKMTYGDLSQRMERSYLTIGHSVEKMVPDKNGVPIKVKYVVNQTINDPKSPRALYRTAKKLYKLRKRGQ